jgi:Bacterial Ig domain
MKKITHKYLSAFSLVFLGLLGGCGGSDVGSGEVGKQQDAAPVAKIEVLGISDDLNQPTTRSGTDVILSGQNSAGIDDPIMQYQWKQIDNTSYKVVLFERTNNTVAFTTPALPADMTDGVTLQFELIVTDADGVSAKNQASVKVIPVGDANRYLVSPQVSEAVRIYIAATPGSTLNANTPARIRVKPIFYWQNRLGEQQEIALDESVYDTRLTSGLAGEILNDSTAFVTVPMPDLDQDLINQYFQGSNRKQRLEIEKLDSVNIEWQISLEVTSGQTISAYLVDPTLKSIIAPQDIATSSLEGDAILTNTGATSITLNIEKLRQALGLESKLTAENYHRCIDPLNQATTFNDWLNQAGFNSANANDIHTKYINNYDLGFGRDMHIRTDENGNVYSYVANYNNLENTISNRNAFAIVVMEYSPAPTGNCGDGTFTDIETGKKIVKFYTYIPNEVTGGYKRALSMNFDGRGEKYIPGSCTACHSGKTNAEFFNSTGVIDAVAADLDSGFMPWDLDAFLYTHSVNQTYTDPAYAAFAATNKLTAETVNKYSRETQENLFKQQNQATLHTLTHDIHKIKRYETAIKLIRGWYSNVSELAELDALNFGTTDVPLSDTELLELQAKLKTLPAGNYQGNFVLEGWRVSEEVEGIYNDVFDRHCRLCHVQMNQAPIDFDSYDEFINNPKLVDYVYAQGSMPMSRLTMDRFWHHFRGETNAAELLRTHLNSAKNANLAQGITPGLPQARISQDVNPELTADVFLDFDEQLILDGSASFFSDTFQWKANSNIVSQTPLLSMNAGEPGISYTITLETQSKGFTSAPESRRISVNNYTPDFTGSLTANVNEGGTVQLDLLNAICADLPDSKTCRPYFGDIRAGQRPTIQLEQNVVNGQLAWINESAGVISFRSTAPSASGNGQFSFRLIDSFGEESSVINATITVSALAAPQIGGNDVCQTNAISSFNANSFPVVFSTVACPNPMLNDTAAPGLSLSLSSVSGSSQQGGTVSLVNGVIRYTPRKYFVGTDSFTYTVVDNSLTGRTNTGSVTVNVSPVMTYTNLKTMFAASCSVPGCHRPAQFGAGPNWSDFATLILRLDDTVGSTAGNLNLTNNTTVAQMLNTYLFIYACSEDNHPGGNQLCNTDLHEVAPTNSSQLNQNGQDILRWIEEGARNN